MENIDFMSLFQGVGTMMESGWLLASARVFLVALGFLLIYLGWKGVLEPMVMIPMGLGMIAINCGTLIMPDGTLGNLSKLFVTRKRSFEPSRKVFTHSKIIVPGRVLLCFKAAVQAFFRFSVDEYNH